MLCVPLVASAIPAAEHKPPLLLKKVVQAPQLATASVNTDEAKGGGGRGGGGSGGGDGGGNAAPGGAAAAAHVTLNVVVAALAVQVPPDPHPPKLALLVMHGRIALVDEQEQKFPPAAVFAMSSIPHLLVDDVNASPT